MSRPDRLPTLFAERVLDLVELIPPGRVMSYGDVAARLGEGGARSVGTALARWGGGVPWWRVLRTDGRPPPHHEAEALRRYAEEGTPLLPDARRVDMARARWHGGCEPEPPAPPQPGPDRAPHSFGLRPSTKAKRSV